MIRSLRAFFLSRVLREKLLLVGFLGIAVIMWATSLSSRASQFWRLETATTRELKEQDMWLARRDQIEAATKSAAAQMDPGKTLDATALNVAVRQLATDTGVKLNTGGATPAVSSGQFSINAQRLTILPTDWKNFTTFYARLQERAPYIAITDLAMQPTPRNPAQVTAAMTVTSFEIKH